jgi:dienelactone hydrolase
MFDFRAMGVSEGAMSSVGALETADVLGAIDFVTGRPELRALPVVAYGMSMGGAVCLRVAAGDTRIRGVATHGSYATLAEAVECRARSLLGPAGPLVARVAMQMGGRWASADLRHAGPLGTVGRLAPRPVLLVHGALDPSVPPSEARRLQAAARGTCDVVLLPHSTHAWVAPTDRAKAVGSLITFFERAAAVGSRHPAQ